MNKSEILAKIDLLRGQGNQTDIAGVLADVLQGAVEGSTLEIPNLKDISDSNKEEASAALGITIEQFDAMVRGEFDKIKVYVNRTLNKVYEEYTPTSSYVAIFGITSTEFDYGLAAKIDYQISSDVVQVQISEI